MLSASVWLGLACPAMDQVPRVDSFHHDGFSGLVQLGWETQPGGVYGVQISTNLLTWADLKSGTEPLRVLASSGNRLQAEFNVPPGQQAFWRILRRPITHVGTLMPEARSGPTLRGVNDHSRVAGYFQDSRSSAQMGFTWAPGEELVSLGSRSYAVAVNNSGVVVGTRYSSGRFFSWTKSEGVVELGDGVAIDINEAGHIVGRDNSGAFLWKQGSGKLRIPHLSGSDSYTVPEALSDAGHVVGVSLIDGNYYRAFLWTESGGLVDLTLPLSSAASGATDVNNAGQVVGHRVIADGTSRAFSWTAAGGIVTFPPVCYITDLNENGQVVGRNYMVGNQSHAFSWTQAGGIVDLGEGSPERVNDHGQIVGYTTKATSSAVLWSPSGQPKELEGLSSWHTVANLISNSGVVFGYSTPVSSAASRLVVWTPGTVP